MSFTDLSNADIIVIRADVKSIQGDVGYEMKELCKKKIEEKVRDVHLDFSSVKYMDSTSIGTLLYVIQLLKKDERKVYLDSVSDEIRQLFKSLILDQFLIM